MKKSIVVLGIGMILGLLFGNAAVYADGFIIPVPPPDVVRVPPLSLKYHRVTVEIDDQVARTKIDQVFLNDFHRDLEGTYIFPLPKGANITDFAMYINGERISAELLEREKARQIYHDIVNRMKDPALLEYFDRDLFKVRVYPIPAHGEKRIQLEYAEVLKADAGLVRYHYPLDTERFSARPLQEVSLAATIRSQAPIKSVYSPSHEVVIGRASDQIATVSFEETQTLPDKDFILYYTVSEKTVGLNLMTYKKTREDGYFMLMVSPGYEAADHQLPKDIVFVLDTSGSMRRDGKMRQAQDALIYGLHGLNADDRFGLVTFSTTVNTFDNVLHPASKDRIQEATQFVDKLESRGGTDIYEALNIALGMFEAQSTRPKILVFLTDGLPTVGLTEYTDILKKVQQKNTALVRLFTFGVGYDVNTHLLDELAESSKAVSAYIEPKEDLEVIVSNFFDKIDAPVLSDLALNIDGAGVYDVFPKALPDLFRGSQLLVCGRYRQSGTFDLSLSGMVQAQKQEHKYSIDFPASALTNDFLPRIWASRKIGYLLDQIRLHGEEQELKEEVIELAKKFGIVTPYTSYLVTEDEEIETDHRPRPRPLFQELSNAPAAGSSGSTGKNAADEMYRMRPQEAPAITRGFTETKDGEVAVRVSKDLQKLKGEQTVSTTSLSDITYIGTKTFYRIDGVWTDSEYESGVETVNIAYGSDAYFKLLDVRPELGQYLSLGDQLILCLDDGLCLKIGPDGIRNADDQKLSPALKP